MTDLPSLKAIELVRALERAGACPHKPARSHLVMRRPGGRSTVIPMHRGEDLDRGLVHKILRDARLSPEEFLRFLR